MQKGGKLSSIISTKGMLFQNPVNSSSNYSQVTRVDELPLNPSEAARLLIGSSSMQTASNARSMFSSMTGQDLVVVNGRLCIPVPHAQQKLLLRVAYPIEEVYVMHEKEPMAMEPGSRTFLKTCQYMHDRSERPLQDIMLSHDLWKVVLSIEKPCCYWMPDDNLARSVLEIDKEVMQSTTRPDVSFIIIVGEVRGNFSHYAGMSDEFLGSQFRIRSVIVLANMPVLLPGSFPISAKSTYQMLLAENACFRKKLEVDRLIFTLTSGLQGGVFEYLFDRYLLRDTFSALHCETFMEDVCFDALELVPEHILSPCMRNLLCKTGRGKKTWVEWNSEFSDALAANLAGDLCLPFVVHMLSSSSLPIEIIRTICEMVQEGVILEKKGILQEGLVLWDDIWNEECDYVG